MTWTNKYSTSYPVSFGLGRAFQCGDNLVWQELNPGDKTLIYSWDGVSGSATEILDCQEDLFGYDGTSYVNNSMLVFKDEVYFCYEKIVAEPASCTFIIAKYSGTPHSWEIVYTSENSFGAFSYGLSKDYSKIIAFYNAAGDSGWTFSFNLYLTSIDGETWVEGSGPDYFTDYQFVANGIFGQRDENSVIGSSSATTYRNHSFSEVNGVWGVEQDLGSESAISFNRTNGDIYSAFYFSSTSTGHQLRSTDYGETSTDTGLVYAGYQAVGVFAAGGRDFIVSGGNLYYYNGSTWSLIEELPQTLLFAVSCWENKLYINSGATTDSAAGWYEHSSFSDWNPVGPEPILSDKIPLSLSSPLLGGTYFWVTEWDGTYLLLKKFASSGTLSSTVTLGECSLEELDSDYTAFVETLSDSTIYVYGRFSLPGLGLTHIMYSTDGGSNFTVLVSNWGTDFCSTLLVDSEATLYGVRTTSTSSTLYTGKVGAFLQRQVLPYNTSMKVKAIDLSDDKTLFLGAGGASSTMILRVPKPYTSYQDITLNHQNTQAVNGLIKL